MADKNSENNEYETVEIGSKTYSRLKSYSDNTEKSLQSIVNDAVNNEITRCEVKEILTEKCESGELPKGSRVCKAVSEEEHY